MNSDKIIYYFRWPLVVLVVSFFFGVKFSSQISFFLKNYIIEIKSRDIVSIATAYAWPLVVLLTIYKFGDSVTRLIGKIGDIEIKIKNLITLVLKQVETEPNLEEALDRTKKEKMEKMLNKLFEDFGKKIDENISD